MANKQKTPYVFSEHANVAHYDWRLHAVTTLTAPVTLGRGIVHEAWSPVVAVCPVLLDAKTEARFNFPNVCALLLDYSHKLWLEATTVSDLFRDGQGVSQGIKVIENDSPFIERLERRMAVAVFAHTAIEAFANEVLTYAYLTVKWEYTSADLNDGKPYTLDDIHRRMPLETKLCSALPEFLKVKSLKRVDVLWQRYRHLTKIRHLIIHPKLQPQTSPKERTLWKMLADNTFRDFSVDAKAIMMHFARDGSYEARWLYKCPF